MEARSIETQVVVCQICGIHNVGPRERCILQPCGHVLCFHCMIERQAARGSSQLTCGRCGSIVTSHVWEKLHPPNSRKRKTLTSSSSSSLAAEAKREAETTAASGVQETVLHPYEIPNGWIGGGRQDEQANEENVLHPYEISNAWIGGGRQDERANEEEVQEEHASATAPSLLAHQPNEVLAHIFSFCCAKSLASLDLTYRTFRLATSDSWEARAKERFGLFGKTDETTGKDAYRAASSLLRPAKVVITPLPWPNLPFYSFSNGTPVQGLSSSGRILVTGCEEHLRDPEEITNLPCENPIVVRDLTSETYTSAIMDGVTPMWEVAIVGVDRQELVLSSEGHKLLHAQRINPISGRLNRLSLNMETVDRERGIDVPYYGQDVEAPEPIHLLGCESMAIVAHRGHFFVYVPNATELLKLVGVSKIDINDEIIRARGMTWLSPEANMGSNSFCCSTHPGRVRVWRAELQLASPSVVIRNILDVQTPELHQCFYAIEVTDKFIVASPGSTKRISVYNHSGALLSLLSEGIDERDYRYEDEDDFIHPICMFAMGEILVSSSVMGAALCIWDLRKGVLLHRLTNLFDAGTAPLDSTLYTLPEGMDFTGLVPLREQGSICCICSTAAPYEFIWSFPGNEERYTELKDRSLSLEEESYGHKFELLTST